MRQSMTKPDDVSRRNILQASAAPGGLMGIGVDVAATDRDGADGTQSEEAMETKQPRVSRRTTFRAIGGLGIGIVTGSILAPTVAAGDDTFAAELNTVRAATRKYRDVEVAKGDGYDFFGVVSHAGVVYLDSDRIREPGIEEYLPPSAVFYAPSEELDSDASQEAAEDTSLELAGLEAHISDPDREGPDQNVFDDETANRKLKVTESDGWHPSPSGGPVSGLHAWVHVENPDGVFARDHPLMQERITEAD